jgi:hypothetical protein
MIAPPRSLHDLSLHLAPQQRRDHSATLGNYGVATTAIGSQFAGGSARYHRFPLTTSSTAPGVRRA